MSYTDQYFTFNGTNSSSFNIYCLPNESRIIKPKMRLYTSVIPGYDGVYDHGIGGHEPAIYQMKLVYNGDIDTLRTNQNAIAAWLYSDEGAYAELRFSMFAGKYYMAKVVDDIVWNMKDGVSIGTISFYLNPPFPYVDDDTTFVYCSDATTKCDNTAPIVPASVATQWANVTSESYLTVTAPTAQSVFPRFYIYGATDTNLYIYTLYNGAYIQLFSMLESYGNDTLYIDGETGKGYLSNGSQINCTYNRAIKFSGSISFKIVSSKPIVAGLIITELAYAM
jgi:phage-related protein